MILSAPSAILLLTLASASPSAQSPAAVPQQVHLFDLAAVRRLFHTLARSGAVMSEGERARPHEG